jgi:hypothetical protein
MPLGVHPEHVMAVVAALRDQAAQLADYSYDHKPKPRSVSGLVFADLSGWISGPCLDPEQLPEPVRR